MKYLIMKIWNEGEEKAPLVLVDNYKLWFRNNKKLFKEYYFEVYEILENGNLQLFKDTKDCDRIYEKVKRLKKFINKN